MSAPWTPPKTETREAFAAFACDAASAQLLREAAVGLGWSPDSVRTGGLAGAVATLAQRPSPQVLLVDLSDCADPLAELGGLAEVCEPGTVVLAAGSVNDVALYRALVGSGLADYLLKPLDRALLRDALAAASRGPLARPRAETAVPAQPRLSVTFIGVRGGVGTSSLAASTAWALAERAKRQTALLDLDLHFGTSALAFDLEPGRGLIDALENPGRIDALFIERAMVKATERLAILSAEAAIAVPLASDGVALHHLQAEMRRHFEGVVIDMPRPLAVEHPELIADAGHIVVVAEPTLACTRDAIRVLGWLKSAAPAANASVVLNKVPAAPEVSEKDFAASIERPVDLILPLDAKAAGAAARGGKCLAATGGGKLGTGFGGLLTLVSGDSPVKAPSLGDRLRSLVAKKA